MKVFISWSGELSKKVAQLLGSWIEDVLQGTKSWISTDDIDKGSIWFGDITAQLSDTSIGIICLTGDNLTSPWILFEAGCLSKGLTKSRVCPFLVNLNHSDLTPPLSQFNGTLPNREDILKLLRTINNHSGEKALSEEKLEKAFTMWWNEFETAFNKIIQNHRPTKSTQRTLPEMVAEILEISRAIQRQVQRGETREETQRIVEKVLGFQTKPTSANYLEKYILENSPKSYVDSGINPIQKAINEVLDEFYRKNKLHQKDDENKTDAEKNSPSD